MKKLVYLLLGICAMMVGMGCSDDEDVRNWKDEPIKGIDAPEEETTDSYHITYQYKEGVIVLSPARQTFLDRVVADTILYFSSDTPEEILPEVGDVVTSSQSEKLPYGLGNIVLSRTEEGGFYKCVTTSTALDQIYSELEVSATFSMLDSLAGGFYDDEGNFIEAEWENPETRADDSPKMLNLNLSKSIANSTLSISGTLALGIDPNLEISLLRGQYECSLDVASHFKGNVKLSGLKVGPKDPRKIFTKTVSTYLPVGPIVLRPFVKIEAFVKPEGKGSISYSFEKGERTKYGFRKNEKGDGFFKENIVQPFTHTDLLDPEIDVNASIELDLPSVDFGLGLYTTRIASGITPKLSFKLEADLNMNEPNLFRNESSILASANVKVDAFFCTDLLFKKLVYVPASVTYELGSWEWPLTPRLKENSLIVEKGLSDPLTFFASYQIEDKGLLSELMNIYPAIHVYKGSEEIYLQQTDQSIYNGTYTFPLTGLDKDTHYTAKPAVLMWNIAYDEDGVPFSAITPTAAITDIVQTGADYGLDAFYYDGQYWDYEFKFYVNVHLVGSQYCESWGIYDPNSVKKYNPCELKEGRQTQYWTAWGNSSSATFSKRPYVILLDGDYIYYNESSHTLTYSEFGDFKSLPLDIGYGDLVFRLDSVATQP